METLTCPNSPRKQTLLGATGSMSVSLGQSFGHQLLSSNSHVSSSQELEN